ncbi:RNA polymerase sigma factor [Paenibacillus luteus]|uniref:RNA polymerase sigma factor n=1 Tax=Paenibacillus luteus TaxID=2545753 RepID=UPI001F4FC5F5|nr:sigma-70 family RNA polymerase sigma factor [Paenibacillus luteus]
MKQWFYMLRSPFNSLDIDTQNWVYRSFYQFVYKDIYFMTRDHALTEDIIQEVFIKSSAKVHQLRLNPYIPSWIKTVARNTTIDFLRKLKKERQMLSTSWVNIVDINLNETCVAIEFELRERNKLLYQTINELKQDYQTVLILFYIESKSYREICEYLQITESVLTQRMVRARKKLLNHFLRKWADDND